MKRPPSRFSIACCSRAGREQGRDQGFEIGEAVKIEKIYRSEGGSYIKLNGHFVYRNKLSGVDPASPPWNVIHADGTVHACPNLPPPPSPSPCVADHSCYDALDEMHTVSTCADILNIGVLSCDSPDIKDNAFATTRAECALDRKTYATASSYFVDAAIAAVVARATAPPAMPSDNASAASATPCRPTSKGSAESTGNFRFRVRRHRRLHRKCRVLRARTRLAAPPCHARAPHTLGILEEDNAALLGLG